MNRERIHYNKITYIFAHSIITLVGILFLGNMFTIAVIFGTANLDFDPKVNEREMDNFWSVYEGHISLSDEGEAYLKKENLWIQVVDNELKEIYAYRKPQKVPARYTPIQYIHAYKYDIAKSSVFVFEKDFKGLKYSYFIGFPISRVGKHNIQYRPSAVKWVLNKIAIIIVFNIMFVLAYSYLYFSKKIGRPAQAIMDQISILDQGNYEKQIAEKGIYQNVNKQLNKLSKTLKENKDKKKSVDELRENWISAISHDMKTPLASIKGFSEMLQNQKYNFTKHEINDYSSIIHEKGLYLEQLIDDLNLSYKLENNAVPLAEEEVEITDLFETLLDTLIEDTKFEKRTVKIVEKQKAIIKLDRHLMIRALSNIIINFLTHNDEKAIIKAYIFVRSERVSITLSDNGPGIRPEEVPYIFEKYFRGTNTTTKTEGSGLGMAIAREIIQMHGGTCSVESVLTKGTTVTIDLPMYCEFIEE